MCIRDSYSFGFYTDVDAYVAAMDARHPNFVANTGTMDGVRITGGSTTEPDKDIAVEVREDATQFGDALSIYPKKTYSGNLAAIPVHKPEEMCIRDRIESGSDVVDPSTGWNTWVSSTTKAGLDEYLAVHQKAYDRASK